MVYSRILPLIGIILFSWLLVLLGSIIVFNFIVPLQLLLPSRDNTVITAVVKAAMSIALILFEFYIILKLRNSYVKRFLFQQEK